MELRCEMNRLDWQGNPGATVRRGEIFEIDDPDRIATWLEAGYATVVLEEEPEDLIEESEDVAFGPEDLEEEVEPNLSEEEEEETDPPKMLGSED